MVSKAIQSTDDSSFPSSSPSRIFNNPHRFIEGWYWALPSRDLKVGQIQPVTLLGRELVIYRGQDGKAIALDAYCPHMGAHLAQGKVDGGSIRCFFHHWRFDASGQCVDIPCLEQPLPVRVKTWPTAEHYALIWVWTGDEPTAPLPFVPELEGQQCEVMLGDRFVKSCHPNVVLVNAIDAHHFNTVHQFPVKIAFEQAVLSEGAIAFHNTTRGGDDSWFLKLIRPFYRNAVTYSLCYWFGSTGTVTLGPDFLHFYIMFALRMLPNGQTEGQTLLITRRRRGVLGWGVSRLLLGVTQWVGRYFARGDTKVFQTIRFRFQTPLRADRSILQFVQHVERQKVLSWEGWGEEEG